MQKFDFLVIGSGPAGKKAAIQAAKLCKRVAIVERQQSLGGVCLHTGTIPSKTLREAVLYLTGWNQRGLYGQGYRLKSDLSIDDLMQRLKITISREIEVMQTQLARNGVEVLEGTASFVDEHTVRIENANGETIKVRSEKFLISTGTRPHRPPEYPFDEKTVLDSDGILKLHTLPKSITVIGAGVIGVEYASIFAALDIHVTLIDGRPNLLGFLDGETVAEFTHYLRDSGVVFRLGETVASISHTETGHVETVLDSGKSVRSDIVMVASGRQGCTSALALENIGLEYDKRHLLKVNDNYQTALPHIYAAGDVIGFPSLASTSMEQGRLSACHAFGFKAESTPGLFPFAVYTAPEMSKVGQTEEELTREKIPYLTGIGRLRETSRGQILGVTHGFVKILFSEGERRVLGVHILGEGASELIHIGQAVLAHGGTIDYFLDNIFNYPTLAEAYKIAAVDAWNRMGPEVVCPVPPVGQ